MFNPPKDNHWVCASLQNKYIDMRNKVEWINREPKQKIFKLFAIIFFLLSIAYLVFAIVATTQVMNDTKEAKKSGNSIHFNEINYYFLGYAVFYVIFFYILYFRKEFSYCNNYDTFYIFAAVMGLMFVLFSIWYPLYCWVGDKYGEDVWPIFTVCTVSEVLLAIPFILFKFNIIVYFLGVFPTGSTKGEATKGAGKYKTHEDYIEEYLSYNKKRKRKWGKNKKKDIDYGKRW